jgi:hypothetical protein
MTESTTSSDPETQQQWDQRIRKWASGLGTEEISSKNIDEYIDTKLYEYRRDKRRDQLLWEMYQEDFADFTPDMFKKAQRSKVYDLRRHLRCAGVFIPNNNKRISVAQSLCDAAREEEQHEWTDEDIRSVENDLDEGDVISLVLNRRMKSNYNSFTKPQIQAQRQHTPFESPRPTDPPMPTESPQPQSYRSQLSEIAKTYSDGQKYDGETGSLDQKLVIFRSICKRAELPEEALGKAFPCMLKGIAEHHFFTKTI